MIDKNLIDIQKELKTRRKLSDAEWEGREGEVKTALEKHYRLLIKQGELYEPSSKIQYRIYRHQRV